MAVHAHTVDYRKEDDRERRGTLVNRGFWLHNLPRVILVCRLFGHCPVVDGTEPIGTIGQASQGARWVCCDRCGVRPDPQGNLDPAQWGIGDPYTAAWGDPLPSKHPERTNAVQAFKDYRYPPGPWPAKPTGALGGQLIIGRTFGLFAVHVKVGNAGSEHTLAAHIRVWPFGALYLNTEQFGTWLQRWLNPTGYQSRVIEVLVGDGRLRWRLWVKRDEHSMATPRWRDGSIRVDPRDIVLGERRYSYEDVGEKATATVRMPHGDDHEVALQLQRKTYGRKHWRKRLTWTVDWECLDGIPTKPGDRGHITSAAVPVSDSAADSGTWPEEAAMGIAAQMTKYRTRYGYRPAGAEVSD